VIRYSRTCGSYQVIRYSRTCGSYHVIRYSRTCGYYQDFSDRGFLPTKQATEPMILVVKSSLRKLYGLQHDFVNRYWIYLSQMATNMFCLS
jgi:hypothetical protein